MASHFSSPLFTFLLGPNQTVFRVYSSFFSEHVSKPLHTMIHGNMKEAREGSAVLDDVEPQVFGALYEFAMGGTYEKTLENVTSENHLTSKKKSDDTARTVPISGLTPYIQYPRLILLTHKKGLLLGELRQTSVSSGRCSWSMCGSYD